MTPETREELARAAATALKYPEYKDLPESAYDVVAAIAPLIERMVAERVAALTAERDAAVDFYNMAKSNTADYERVVIAMGERRATAAIVAWLRSLKPCNDQCACELATSILAGYHLKPLDT